MRVKVLICLSKICKCSWISCVTFLKSAIFFQLNNSDKRPNFQSDINDWVLFWRSYADLNEKNKNIFNNQKDLLFQLYFYDRLLNKFFFSSFHIHPPHFPSLLKEILGLVDVDKQFEHHYILILKSIKIKKLFVYKFFIINFLKCFHNFKWCVFFIIGVYIRDIWIIFFLCKKKI